MGGIVCSSLECKACLIVKFNHWFANYPSRIRCLVDSEKNVNCLVCVQC